MLRRNHDERIAAHGIESIEANLIEMGKGEMKNFTIMALLVLSAALCSAQVPKASIYSPKADVYVGYIATNPDYGPTFGSFLFSGVELAYTETLRPHLAITGDAAFSFGTKYKVKEFSGTVGPRFNVLTGRFRPYVTAQLGLAVQNSNGMYATDHHPPLAKGANATEDGLTYRVGMGADLQVTHKLYWRVIQWDIQPQPWARNTPQYWNFSSGIGYRF